MSSKTLFSIVESPTHPFLSPLYKQLNIEETIFKSMRKVISTIKKTQPDYITAEFFYGYGNNYAGINLSNLDVMLISLQRYSKDTKVVVFVDKNEREFVDKLNDILPLHAIIQKPIKQTDIITALK